MKDLVNKFLSNLHFIILFYGLYGAYTLYDEHTIQLESVTNQIPGVETQIQNMEKKVAEIQDFMKKADEYKARVEGVAKNIESVQKQLPADINDTEILDTFNQEIRLLNIKDPNVVPGVEEVSTYYILKNYTMKASGTFLQFLVFFERLGNTTRIFNIKSLKLINAEQGQKGRFQMISAESVIQAFRYNPAFKVDRGFDKIENPTVK